MIDYSLIPMTMTTEEKILKAALELFVSRGFNTPTSEITKKAKVSSGILFHYFPTKDDLILTLYANILGEYYQSGFVQIDDEVMADRTRFESNIRRAWSAIVQWGVRNWEKFQYMQQFENTPYLDKYQSRKSADIQRVQKYLAEETKLAIEKGISKDLPVDFLIRTGSGLIISTIKFLHENPKWRESKEFMEQALQMYLCANER